MPEKHYWSDKPCPKGHVGLRYKSSWQCVRCTAERRAEITKSRGPIYQANRRERYATDPEERAKARARNKRLHEEKGDQYNEARRKKWAHDEEYRSKQKATAAARRARPGYAEAVKAYQLKRFYGLSAEQFACMREKQGGCCAICGASQKQLVVDHCHDTGRVRELLCHSCNRGIGMLADSHERLQAAADYLRRHSLDGVRDIRGHKKRNQ